MSIFIHSYPVLTFTKKSLEIIYILLLIPVVYLIIIILVKFSLYRIHAILLVDREYHEKIVTIITFIFINHNGGFATE